MFKKVLLVSLVLSGFVFPQIAGVCFAATAELEQADQLYQYVIGLWPEDQNNPIWPQMREAMTCIALGNDANAEAAIDKLLTDFSENKYLPVALNATGDIYRQFKNYEKATQLLQYVIGHWPRHEFAMWSRSDLAEINIELGKSEAAEAAIEELLAELAVHPGLPLAVYRVANKYQELPNHERAIQLYQYIVDNWPENDWAVEAQMDVAISNIALGKDSEAQAATDKLLAKFAVHPELPEAVYKLADKYQILQRHEQARQLYQYIVDNWPESNFVVLAQMDVAISNLELGNDAEAEAATSRLLADFALHPELPEALYEVANKYQKMRMHERARQLFQRVLDNWPGHEAEMWSLSGVATSDSGLGNVEAADAGIEKLLTEFSGDPNLSQAVLAVAEPYYVEGLRKKGEGLDSQAKECFQKVLAIVETVENRTPGYVPAAETCCWTGVTYQALGEYRKSIECYQKVVDDYPDHSLAWYALYMVASNYEDLKESGVISKTEANSKIKAVYEQLLENYPDCKVVEIAQRWLNSHNSK